jgi:hypothetical protein
MCRPTFRHMLYFTTDHCGFWNVGRAPAKDQIRYNAISVPFSTNMRPAPGFQAQPVDMLSKQKSLLAFAAFGLDRSTLQFPTLRRSLRQQCLGNKDCRFHSLAKGKSDPKVLYDNYRSAWFCIQPPGDLWSRKAIYDCLQSLAIPVVFDKGVLSALAFADVIDYSGMMIVLDDADVGNVMEILRAIPLDTRQGMLANIKKVGVMSYMCL